MNKQWRIRLFVTFACLAVISVAYVAKATDDEITATINTVPSTGNQQQRYVESYFQPTTDGIWIVGSDPCGYFGNNTGGNDAYIAKETSSGSIQWSQTYGSAGNDSFNAVYTNTDGNLIVSGQTNGNLFGATAGNISGIVACINTSGSVQWSKVYPETTKFGIDVVVADGDVIVSYTTTTTPAQNRLVCYTSSGTQKWDIQLPYDTTSLSYLGQSSGVFRFQGLTKKHIYQDPVAGEADKSEIFTFGLSTSNGSLSLNGHQFGNLNMLFGVYNNTSFGGYDYGAVVSYAGTIDSANINSGVQLPSFNLSPHNASMIRGLRSFTDYALLVVDIGTYENEASHVSDQTIDLMKLSSTGLIKVSSLSSASYCASYIRQDGGVLLVTQDAVGHHISLYSNTGQLLQSNLMSFAVSIEQMAFHESSSGINYAMKGTVRTGEKQLITGSFATVAAPTFSPASGTYTGTQSVSISCATTGATIRYTTDGSEPTETSTQYTAPIAMSTNKTVKARAFKTATLPSLRSDAKYTVKK